MMMTFIPVLGFGPEWWTPFVPLVSREDILCLSDSCILHEMLYEVVEDFKMEEMCNTTRCTGIKVYKCWTA